MVIRVKIDGRIRVARIDLEELKRWKDALDDLRDEEVKAFVHARGDDFAQAIEQVVKEDQSPEKVRDIIRLTAADLADLCP